MAAPCRAQAKLRRLLVPFGVHRADHDCRTADVQQAGERNDRGGRRGQDRRSRGHARRRAMVATLEASRALRDALAHLGHLQRGLSRTQKGSANRAKARRPLGRTHAPVGAVRTSRLHQFTAKLAKSHAMIVVEDIATANLMRNHHLAQAIGDQGWGELARQLGYQTTRAGGTLVVADLWFPSSKTVRMESAPSAGSDP
jgi:hypothetical protein